MALTIPSGAVKTRYLPVNRALGNNEATATYKCDFSVYSTLKTALLWNPPDENAQLACDEVRPAYMQGDNQGCYEVTAHYVPLLTLLWKMVNMPWHPSWEEHVEALTVRGFLYWESDSKPFMCRQATPAVKVVCHKLMLRGVRSSEVGGLTFHNQGALDAFAGTVNSDAIAGATAGQILYHGYNAVARPYEDGSQVFDVAVELLFRQGSYGGTTITWNHFWREDTGAFDRLLVGGPSGNPVYSGKKFLPIMSL